MLDLVAQVATRERQQATGVEVRSTEHLSEVPLGSRFLSEDVFGELLRTVGKMTAEDDHVCPEIAQQICGDVRAQRSAPAEPAQRGKEHVVFHHLPADLPG